MLSRFYLVLTLLIMIASQTFALTDTEIWGYQNRHRHADAAAIISKDFDKLISQYKLGNETVKQGLQYKLLKTYYNLGWCQLYGRLYDDHMDAYKKFRDLNIPAAKWGNKMLWTVRSAAATGATLAAKGKYKLALLWLNWANKLYKLSPYQKRDEKTINPFTEFYNNGYCFYALQNFIKKKQKNINKKAKYTMTVLYFVFSNVDYTIYNGKNKPRIKVNYKWKDIDYKNLKVSQQLMKLAIEGFSDGNLSLKFINKTISTKVHHNPKTGTSITDFSSPVYQERMKTILKVHHDLVVDHILSNDTGATGHGGGGNISTYELPNAIASWTTLVHEFFHNTETKYGWKPHAYWGRVPGWNGKPMDEMSYYEWRFRTGIRAKVNQETAKNSYSGWITEFNWGEKDLRDNQ